MSFPELFSKTRDLIAAAQTMGVLGAELRLRQMGKEGHPRIRESLRRVLDTLEPGLLNGLEPGQIATIVGQLTYGLQDALDLIRDPERAPGWAYTDPAILQERGRGSRAVVRNIANLARQRPALAAALSDAKFLDIGTGVGWLAIEAAKTWSGMQIVGLDIWVPSLELARTNCMTPSAPSAASATMDIARASTILRPDWNRRSNCTDDADGADATYPTSIRQG